MPNNQTCEHKPNNRSVLYQALNHQTFIKDQPFLTVDDTHLYGVMTIDPFERNHILDLFDDERFASYYCINQSASVILFMPPSMFDWHNHHGQTFHFSLGYSANFHEQNKVIESLSTLVAIHSEKSHEIFGYFKFNVGYTQYCTNKHYFNISLERLEMCDRPAKVIDWLNLTLGAKNFLVTMVDSVAEVIGEDDKVRTMINMEFAGGIGEKIAYVITSELNLAIDGLRLSNPNKLKCFSPATSHSHC